MNTASNSIRATAKANTSKKAAGRGVKKAANQNLTSEAKVGTSSSKDSPSGILGKERKKIRGGKKEK